MIYKMEGRIRYSETDGRGKLSIGSLVDYLQDCATFQSEELGIGVDFLKERSQGWILVFWQIVIDRLPAYGEKITTATWAYEFKYCNGLRNFTMTGADGKICVKANSCWVLYDGNRRRPVRIPAPEEALYDPEERLDMDYAPRKIHRPAVPTEDGTPILVTREYLDTNHHVNNGKYIRMALAARGAETVPREVRAEYRMQAKEGDVIIPSVYREEGRTTVSLHDADNKPYAVVAFLE